MHSFGMQHYVIWCAPLAAIDNTINRIANTSIRTCTALALNVDRKARSVPGQRRQGSDQEKRQRSQRVSQPGYGGKKTWKSGKCRGQRQV
jgi:hypothetical protein